MKIKLVSELVSEKIQSNKLSIFNYISTENLLPNFGGVIPSSKVPDLKCSRFRKYDILLSNIRPYFKKVWFANFDGGCSNDVLVIRPKTAVLPRFLYYSLANDKFINFYNSSCKGTKMPRGNKDSLLDYEISVPAIPEQQHIVNTTSSLLLKSL